MVNNNNNNNRLAMLILNGELKNVGKFIFNHETAKWPLKCLIEALLVIVYTYICKHRKYIMVIPAVVTC